MPDTTTDRLDPVTLSVMQGALTSTVRQMTVTMERVAVSPILKLVHDYSNAVFDARLRLVAQGNDLPIHIGSLALAARAVADYFGDDVHEGDVFYHNDPTTGGSHYQDMSMLKPVFFEGRLVFWVASKVHMDDTGGAVAGGYNPLAEDSYAEGLRIPALRLYDKGRARKDVIDLICKNVRTTTAQRADMDAQLAVLRVAERNLLELLRRFGTESAETAVDAILDSSERNMRAAIAAMPDGIYEGSAPVEDNGRTGNIEIKCRVEIEGDELTVLLSAPAQVPSYVNSYWANTISAAYWGILIYAQPPQPYNSGLYRPITVEIGPEGTLVNAVHPAPCSAATTTVGDNITDAVADAMSKAVPARANAAWCHCGGTNMIGSDPRTGEFYNFNMIIGTSGGAGATVGLDGWNCLNARSVAGACLIGDVELLETDFPIRIHRYELLPDSAGAGQWRGGSGAIFEVSPVDHDAGLVLWGEGRNFAAPGLLGAPRISDKTTRKYLVENNTRRELPWHEVTPISAGQRFIACPSGGGGVGNPFLREADAVVADVRNGIVTVEAARTEYGVVVNTGNWTCDAQHTAMLRAGKGQGS